MLSLLVLIVTVAGRFQKNVFVGSNPWTDHRGVKTDKSGAPIPECHMTPSYPPPQERLLMEFVIDLDSDAKTRWSEPTTHFKDGINKLLKLVTGSLHEIPKYIDKNIDTYLSGFPKDWDDELRGITDILNANISDVFLYNIAYEIFGLCTSIVAQDESGHIYHGRNLDFGLWPAMNFSDIQWELTAALRDVIFNVNFTKNGELFYRSTVFGGYIGLLTGMKHGVMSLSVNSRYDANHDKYLLEYLRKPTASMQWLTLTTRSAMEDYTSYDDAIAFIKTQGFIGPCYLIIGGINKGEGCVLSIGPNMTLFDDWRIPEALPVNNSAQEPFYVLETNYDHWEEPSPFDDRRYPGEMCMDEIGSKGVEWYTLYNVLNAIPTRNRLTTYTTLMDTASGQYVAYKQYCDTPECAPW